MAILIANQNLTELEFLLSPDGENAGEVEEPEHELKLFNNYMPGTEDVVRTLNEIANAAGYGGPNVRESLLERGAYTTICKAWKLCCWSGVPDVPSPAESAIAARDPVLRALYALTAGFPETIDDVGWQIVTQGVDKTVPEETQILTIKVIRNVCLKSEENREHFTWGLGLLDPLLSLAFIDDPSSKFIREWCATVKTILLSDDPRVTFNRAPDRKRVVAQSRILPIIANFLNKPEFFDDEGALNAIVILLGTMAINEDLCIQIESGNVLPGIQYIIMTHFRNKTLLRNTVALLRYLAGDMSVRDKCATFTFMRSLIEIINYYKKDADLVDVTISCIGYLTLKSACETSQFISKHGLPLFLHTMMDYNKDITILKGACFALRNVCENTNDEGRQQMVELGYASIFSQMLKEVPELKEYYIMPILRELGLNDIANAAAADEEEHEEEEEEEEPSPKKQFDDKAFMLQEEFGEDGMMGLLSGMGI